MWLILDPTAPVIVASPDRIVSCSCCGISCLEIKYPMSINYTHPDDKNAKLDYLVEIDDKLKLDCKHKYYTQVQMQMSVTGHRNTYFVIWTPHGISIEEIKFDEDFWILLKEQLLLYYDKYYLASVFSSTF